MVQHQDVLLLCTKIFYNLMDIEKVHVALSLAIKVTFE
jgi:hypothetical protein